MADDYGLEQPAIHRTNQAAKPTDCATCHGDRYVLVRLRSPTRTVWMAEHGIEPNPREFHEEYAPCPDCNNIQVLYRGFRQLDPGLVRAALR